MTIVRRTGPFSASSALATTSWYQRGKSTAWDVSTLALAMREEAIGGVPWPVIQFGDADDRSRDDRQERRGCDPAVPALRARAHRHLGHLRHGLDRRHPEARHGGARRRPR